MRLLVQQIPGLGGPRKLRFSISKYSQVCVEGHSIPKRERVLKIYNSMGANPTIVCLPYAVRRGWVK